MTSMPSSLWIATALCLAGLGAGMVLHLKWHPLKRHFSDAWDLMLACPWLTITAAALWLLSGAGNPGAHTGPWPLNELLTWRELAVPLLLHALTMFARMLHQLFPVWPLALLLPLALSLLLWRVARRPYFYGPRKMSMPSQTLLILAAIAAWAWVAMESVSFMRGMAEWGESIRAALRLLAIAVTTAACQVVVIRLLIGWESPEDPDDQRDVPLAVEHALARWQGVFALAGFNLLWLLWREQIAPANGAWRDWLLPEVLLAFAPLPVAVAHAPGGFLHQGGRALRALCCSFWPLLAILVTAVAILMLVHYPIALMAHAAAHNGLAAMIFLPVHALVLATVHNWLFLAAVFTLLRHGFRPDANLACAH